MNKSTFSITKSLQFNTNFHLEQSNPRLLFSYAKKEKILCNIICATDAVREEELIFRFVYDMTGCEKPFLRLWISSMEETADRMNVENR